MKNYIVHAKQWFDKVHGNSYNAVRIYDLEHNLIVALPFEYGYGDYYLQRAKEWLIKNNHPIKGNYYREMFAYHHKDEGCKKRDVKAWGEA